MAKTIKQTAIELLTIHEWKQDNRGAYCSPKTPTKIYLGRGHSIRKGTTKAASKPTTVYALGEWLKIVATRPDLEQPVKLENPLTVARKALHEWIGKLDQYECEYLIGECERITTPSEGSTC